MANRTKKTDRACDRFFGVLSIRCNITEAARAAGVARGTVYEWKDSDPEFAQAWEEAEAIGADHLQAEAWRRAVDGVDEPVIYKGRATGQYVRKYSDRLLELLLKGHMPDRFRNDTILGGGVVFAGLVVIGPGGETLGNGAPGDGARDITPAPTRKLNGGKSNGKD